MEICATGALAAGDAIKKGPSTKTTLEGIFVALCSALALALVFVQPSLLVFALAGTLLGTAVSFALAYGISRPRRKPPAPRQRLNRRPLFAISALGIAGSVLGMVALVAGTAIFESPSGPIPPIYPARPPEPREGAGPNGPPRFERPAHLEAVRSVHYAGVLEYDEAQSEWEANETVRIARGARPDMVRHLRAYRMTLGRRPRAWIFRAEWHYAGSRGKSGKLLAYRRRRTIHVDTPGGWPATGEESLPIGAFRVADLAATLVPADGSLVELRAPHGFVKETDPAATMRQFAGDDIFTMHLEGLEDDARRRVIHLEVANGIARSSLYGALESMTAWGIVKLLFGGLPAIAAGLLLGRWFERRSSGPEKGG